MGLWEENPGGQPGQEGFPIDKLCHSYDQISAAETGPRVEIDISRSKKKGHGFTHVPPAHTLPQVLAENQRISFATRVLGRVLDKLLARPAGIERRPPHRQWRSNR
jgi:hypothetical protein